MLMLRLWSFSLKCILYPGGGAFLKLLLTNENISKDNARRSNHEHFLKTQFLVLEYSLNFISTNQHELCSLLGLCSFKDGDYLSEFVRAEQKK